MDGLPDKFFESFIRKGIKVDLLEPGRIVCSFKVPPQVEIEAEALRVWKAIGVASVELRRRHAKL
ncbi:acyl-coenzyme A thioesterase 13 [Prunus yedoensis var. nudiflora]|uniref:Acyl-coenzyme A thioesterase 13 n=1 Tax=Prunus yedoensis var. nudiflora TaxID=2094558 RepID=A0A314UUA7_PRUYE|nr:acyl-coenzyme A thioesterase 13 [Prunus yedoensis var. nudiflora]